MKRVAILAVLAVLAGGMASAQELLTNPGFEGATLTPWANNGCALPYPAKYTTDMRTGVASCKVSVRNPSSDGISQDIKAALQDNGPGDYTVSAYIKIPSATAIGRIQIGQKIGAAAMTYSDVTGTILASGWMQVFGTFNCPDSTGLSAATFFINTTESLADLYVDDCSLRKGLSVATPTIAPNGGSDFIGTIGVTLACATADAAIYYTTDGSAPSASSTPYSTPFTLAASATVKAIAVKAAMNDSTVAFATFTARPPGSILNGSFEHNTYGWTVTPSAGNYDVNSVNGKTDGAYSLELGNLNTAAGDAVFS